MAPTTPTPDDRALLERLAAAGPVLDELYRDAAEPRLERAHHGQRHDPHRVRRRDRSPHPRRRALAALLVLLAAGTAGAIALSSGGDPQVVKANRPTSTTTTLTDAQLAELVKTRVVAAEACGPMPRRDQVPITWPSDWDIIGGFEACITGWVYDGAGDEVAYPVYPTPEVTTPQAYWGPDVGWIPLDEYRDPGFDLERYRTVYREVRAQVAASKGGH